MWRLTALLMEIMVFLGNLREIVRAADMRRWAAYRTVVAIYVARITGIADFKFM